MTYLKTRTLPLAITALAVCWALPIGSTWGPIGSTVGLLGSAGAQEKVASSESDEENAATKADRDFFEKRIRPVLANHCYECHSVEAAQRGKLRGGLFLDTRDASRKGGESGPAVVPGKPDDSLLLGALSYDAFEMPPKGQLSASVVADFRQWIERGAFDPRTGTAGKVPTKASIDIEAGRKFWSLQPIRRATPPRDASGWSRTDVDRFVRARQEAAGIESNGRATPRLLIRRAWFDLIGLPPTPAEIDHWTKRLTSGRPEGGAWNPQAWEELVDHLLESPHYGERWARHWMDVARFAESHGYEQDYDRKTAYHYRDFLIRAFNRDLPYDEFVRWQIAGDELEPDDPLAWMATGFLGAGAFPTQLTEAEFESARYDELDDMVSTIGVAFLGLSVGCARCHDHKFDPIPSRDYYRLAACFTTAIRSERELDLTPQANQRRRLEHAARRDALQAELTRFEQSELPVRFRRWLADTAPQTGVGSAWQVLQGAVKSSGGSTYNAKSDGSYLASGKTPNKEVITFRTTPGSTTLASIRLEALADNSLPGKGPGKASNGNFALGDFQVRIFEPDDKQGKLVRLRNPRATHQQNPGALSIAASIDADSISGWAVDGKIGHSQAAAFDLAEPLPLREATVVEISMRFEHPNRRHAIGRFRLAISEIANLPPKVGEAGPGPKVRAALAACRKQVDEESEAWTTALGWYRSIDAEWLKRSGSLQSHVQAGPKLEMAKVLVTSEGLPHLKHHADGRGFPHFYPETHVLRRGDVHQKVDVAQPGFLQVLTIADSEASDWFSAAPPESRTSYRRTGTARWLTDVEQGAGGLAARVMVNRLWQHHFGRGLVATPNDFGASGERPTHPQLLDWLASELIRGEWRLKRMHKLLMTSEVYLQSSQVDAARSAVDPDNRWLWRRVPRRLEAEAIRDAMLAVSGTLDLTMYGPGSLDPNMRRRSVYFFIKRSRLIPTMMLFDWPEHLVSIGRRASTTIAPQALMFMNGGPARTYAAAFAAKLPEVDAEAVRDAYRLALGRTPGSRELEAATAFLTEQTAAYKADGRRDAGRLARTDLCQTLLSINEFVFVD